MKTKDLTIPQALLQTQLTPAQKLVAARLAQAPAAAAAVAAELGLDRVSVYRAIKAVAAAGLGDVTENDAVFKLVPVGWELPGQRKLLR